MTPDQIEAALEQPEFHNPLRELAKARIALESATDSYVGVFGETVGPDVYEDLDDREMEFFESLAGPFGETAGHEDAPADIIKDYCGALKATYLSPEYRLEEAISWSLHGDPLNWRRQNEPGHQNTGRVGRRSLFLNVCF